MTKRRAVEPDRMWPVADLKPHPQQSRLFTPPTAEELAALAADIHQHGLREPLRILPDGTVVSGHSRLTAVQQLGWVQVPVVVDAALAAAGADAVVARLITENLVRRQLGPLDRARCVRQLFELERGSVGTPGSSAYVEVRDRVGKQVGLSGRNAERYLRAIDAPGVIQQAFARGEIGLVTAARVGCLPARQRRTIAAEVEAGEPAAAVLRRHLARPAARQVALNTRLSQFDKHLAAALDALGDHAATVRSLDEAMAARLGEARRVIDRLLEQAVLISDDLPGPEARFRDPETLLPPLKDLNVNAA